MRPLKPISAPGAHLRSVAVSLTRKYPSAWVAAGDRVQAKALKGDDSAAKTYRTTTAPVMNPERGFRAQLVNYRHGALCNFW